MGTAARRNGKGALRNFLVVLGLTIGNVLAAQTMEVEGTAFLTNGNNPTGIQIIFEAISPSAHTDTAITNIHGMFDIGLTPGNYVVTYFRFGYAVYEFGTLSLRSNLLLPRVTLMPGMQGPLMGIVGPGDFHVTDSLWIAAGETATILPGTRLYFSRMVPFYVAGRLIAEGTADDSILFSRRYATGFEATWRGLTFVNPTDTSRLKFLTVEHATKSPYGHGGGLYCSNANVTLTQCTFRYNHADYGGGAFFVNCSPVIESCMYLQNDANAGGGLGLVYSAATVADDSFRANSAVYTGGGLYAESGNLSANVIRCQFFENNSWDGAGAAVLQTPTYFDRCVFSQNTANRTATILFNNAPGATASRCTMADNTGQGSPAFSSIAVFNGASVITSCVIAESNMRFGILFSVASNAAVRYCDFYIIGGEAPIGFSAGDTAQGPHGIGIPDTLNDHGDTTDVYRNIFLNPEFNDSLAYHLYGWSPCIDTGDPLLPLDPDSTVADMGAYYYGIEASAHTPAGSLPSTFGLSNYPNPFNSRTRIVFDLPRAGSVRLDLFDVLGRRVQTLFAGPQTAGRHQLDFDGTNLAAGSYFYHLSSGTISQTRKLVLLK